ncbi:hypothetical protein EJ110_NYTH42543 [Nymphaea thermarum]|nr:hypothetical protein EJ110_NYTH42543 [Nymphaea thermarum]
MATPGLTGSGLDPDPYVAYVLGQLQDRTASLALAEILKKKDEHPMVRHEAAEALGSIADCESISLLETFTRDPEPIVSQSCEVALSILEFERCGKPFEGSLTTPGPRQRLQTIVGKPVTRSRID